MTSFHFPVTPWMSPGLRLLAFSVRGSAQRPEVITDSTWLDIAEQCGQEVLAFRIHSGILVNRNLWTRGISIQNSLWYLSK